MKKSMQNGRIHFLLDFYGNLLYNSCRVENEGGAVISGWHLFCYF